MKNYILIILTFILSAGVVIPSAQAQKPIYIEKKDYQAYRDSLKAVLEKRMYEYAEKRFEKFLENDRKDTITVLKLTSLYLEKFPEEVFECTSLKELHLRGNLFTKIPGRLRKMDSLDLLVWENYPQFMAEEKGMSYKGKIKMPRLRNLKYLSLEEMSLEKVPASVKKQKQLKELVLANNQIASAGNRLRKLSKLEEITLNENPVDMTTFSASQYPASLEVLRLNKCELQQISPEIYKLSLKDLQLRENKLQYLPAGIAAMTTLRDLSLYKNYLQEVPEDLYELHKLRFLDLHYNEIKEVSPKISNFDSLEVLYLARNEIRSIPETIGTMGQLKELYIHNNRIQYLPASIGQLTGIRYLRTNHNLLNDFPAEVLGMKQLEFLDISGNLIKSLPEQLRELNKLEILSYENNDIDMEDPESAPTLHVVADLQEKGVTCTPSVVRTYIEKK